MFQTQNKFQKKSETIKNDLLTWKHNPKITGHYHL